MIDRPAILGASVRAAAFSAIQAGLHPSAIDLFADADLAARCPTQKIGRYPKEFAELFPQLNAEAWMYTGGLENHPSLIERLAKHSRLLGNSKSVLQKVRDPFWLGRTLAEAGFLFPPTVTAREEVPGGGSWIVKPFASAGGQRIAVWDNTARDLPSGCYLQKIIAGEAYSAAFIAARGNSQLLGATRQLLNRDDLSGGSFQYAGSIGPLDLSETLNANLHGVGALLASEARIEGLFGIDFILRGGRIWVIEVNPRYTASMEVLERALDVSFVALHIDACLSGRLPSRWPKPSRIAGKRIVYADQEIAISNSCSDRLLAAANASDPPSLADIPSGGETIAIGRPILTMLVDGDDIAEVESRLVQSARHVASLLRR